MASPPHDGYGIKLQNGSTIVHGTGANIKHPFSDIPVVMHELDPGSSSVPLSSSARAFRGQLGFIEFSTDYRLPRHVHIAPTQSQPQQQAQAQTQRFICERIVVLEGVALVELNGDIYVIPPKSLVTIAPGVPHTWTACPAGVSVVEAGQEGTTKAVESTGTFLMLYEYEDPTAFFPTRQTETLTSVDEYQRCDDLESIRIPKLSAQEVYEQCIFVWDRTLTRKKS